MTSNIFQIWDKICQGDHAAWQELVNLYAGLVYSVARRAGLPEPDAEDCTQLTWLNLYRKRSSIKDPVALPAWLIKTTHRQATAMAQKLRRPADLKHLDDAQDPAKLPDEVIQALEIQAAIQAGMKLLDPRCRQLINEMYFSGRKKSYRALAKSLKVAPNTLGPMRSRCLERLRIILKKMGIELH